MKNLLRIIFTGVAVLGVIGMIMAWLDDDEPSYSSSSQPVNSYSPQTANSGSSQTAGPSVFRIVNNTGYDIWELYISPSSSDNWGNELLGRDVLGRSEFTYRPPQSSSRVRTYDIKAVDNDGDAYIKMNVRVSDGDRIILTMADYYGSVYDNYGSSSGSTVYTQPTISQSGPAQQTPSQPAPAQPQPSQPAASPAQPAAQPAAGNEANVRTAIVNAARRYLGAPYVYGAQSTSPMRFDCSGLVNQAYKEAANITIPRSSAEMWSRGKRINRSDLNPGDIIVYSENGRTPSHVSLYVDSVNMIHAASAGSPTGVVQQRQDTGTWPRKIIGYVTFVGTAPIVSRNTKSPVVTDFYLELTGAQQRFTEPLPVLAGTGLGFTVTNNTGSNGQFDAYFYRTGSSRADGETEALTISNGETVETVKSFFCEDPGQYIFEVVRRSDNRTLLEYTYNIEE